MTREDPTAPPTAPRSALPSAPDTAPPVFHAEVPELLAERGFGPEAAAALTELDTALFFWHRFAARGEMARLLLAEMGVDLELTQFQALTAVVRIEHGLGRTAAEPATVGLVAEEMAIDPSRASRITSGLIEAGYLRREAAQDDGRKAVLVLTEASRALFQRFKALKWARTAQVFEHWSEDDIRGFARLFRRYGEDIRRVYFGAG